MKRPFESIDRKKIRRLFVAILIMLIAFILGIVFTRWQQLPLIQSIKIHTDQNAEDYLNPATKQKRLIDKTTQQALAQHFLTQYFSPWHNKQDPIVIKNNIQNTMNAFEKDPGWGMNYQRHSLQWMQKIAANINLNTFPNENKNAIVLRNTELRVLPTDMPSFSNYHEAGEGYPFDNLQISALWTGAAVHVFQITQDGEWGYVSAYSVSGWVKLRDIAYVDPIFIQQYEHHQFVTVIKDDAPVKDSQGNYLFKTRIGSLFPIEKNNILIPIKNQNHQAEIIKIAFPKNSVIHFPLSATPEHFALLINHMVGEPYGWGGYQHWRDCSLTTQSLLADFGVYLPRNSEKQSESGQMIDLSHLTVKQKLNRIQQQGKPFLTLIGLPGHIMLYIGQKDHQLYAFNNKWGLLTKNLFGDEGRAVIGSAMISPLSFNRPIPNVPYSLIQDATSMTLFLQHENKQ